MMEKVYYNDDVYEVTHFYPNGDSEGTLMVMYRQPTGWGGYEIKVHESQCHEAPLNALNKREMLVRIGWQNDDDVLAEQCKQDYQVIYEAYSASPKNGKWKKD